MSWTQITARDTTGLAAYQSVLDSDAAYAGSTVAGLRKILKRENAQLWLWDDGQLRLVLGIYTSGGRGIIVNAMPDKAGIWNAKAACQIAIRKLRQIFDALSVEEFEATGQQAYGSDAVNQFMSEVQRIIWEVTAEDRTDSVKLTFSRTTAGKIDDENWDAVAARRTT